MSWMIIEDDDGRRHRVAVVRSSRGVWVGWHGGSTLVQSNDSFAVGTEQDADLRAPMTGKVIAVKVEPGANVEADELLLVLEAMKMEYQVTAPRAAKVESVLCGEGDLVD